jgi:ribosomal protein S18 acetylase RimI-like enzyme
MGEKTEIKFRRAKMQDAELLAEMGRSTFEVAFGPKNDPEDIQNYLDKSFSLEQIQSEIEDGGSLFLLAYQEERPIGYSKLIANKGHDCVEGNELAELQRIYVVPEAIGAGIGSQLLLESIEQARKGGHQAIWLGVWEENKKAIRFYQRHGFVKQCSQEFMLGSDLQYDWVMLRAL